MNIFDREGDSRTADEMHAAHLRHIQNLTMDAIASELTISRSSVRRFIAFARDSGLVEIRLHSPIDQLTQLQHQLPDRFGLTAHIVRTGNAVTEIYRLDRVAMSAARILTDFIDSTMIPGVAWGSTIASVRRHLVRKDADSNGKDAYEVGGELCRVESFRSSDGRAFSPSR